MERTLDLAALQQFKPQRDRELPFVYVEQAGFGTDAVYRPVYADGVVGAYEPALGPLIEGDKLGDCHRIIWGGGVMRVVPWWGDEKLTPFGPTSYPSRDRTLPDYKDRVDWQMTEAAMAEQRRLSQGTYDYYDHDWIRGIMRNEGIEYGLCAYTSVDNYVEDVRPLARAAVAAIEERDSYVNGESSELAKLDEDADFKLDEKRLAQLARKAEAAKETFCRCLSIENESWQGPA